MAPRATLMTKVCCILTVTAVMQFPACSDRSPHPPHILLIVIDALRADRLGCYGNEGGVTPFLDSLAARGVVFHNAYAQSSWTRPSIASLLTSRYPSQHGVGSLRSVLAEEAMTLPEVLRAAGYATAGFSANPWLLASQGFGQGYRVYRVVPAKPGRKFLRPVERARGINRMGLEWLGRERSDGDAPFFLYLHYMEPHIPYAPPPPVLERYFSGRTPPDLDDVNAAMLRRPVPPDLLRQVLELYEAEIMSLDGDLRSLFDELDRRRLLEDALVVITADHGEEFEDHGFLGHGRTLYNEVVRVPLIVVPPGQKERVDVDEAVSLIDIAPTLIDWIGGEIPASFEGRSLLPSMRREKHRLWALVEALWNRRRADPVAVTELLAAPMAMTANARDRDPNEMSMHERAVVSGSKKLIAGINGEREFYDLETDSAETNEGALAPVDRARLEKALADFSARVAGSRLPLGSGQLDPQTEEAMRALGYFD